MAPSSPLSLPGLAPWASGTWVRGRCSAVGGGRPGWSPCLSACGEACAIFGSASRTRLILGKDSEELPELGLFGEAHARRLATRQQGVRARARGRTETHFENNCCIATRSG